MASQRNGQIQEEPKRRSRFGDRATVWEVFERRAVGLEESSKHQESHGSKRQTPKDLPRKLNRTRNTKNPRKTQAHQALFLFRLEAAVNVPPIFCRPEWKVGIVGARKWVFWDSMGGWCFHVFFCFFKTPLRNERLSHFFEKASNHQADGFLDGFCWCLIPRPFNSCCLEALIT